MGGRPIKVFRRSRQHFQRELGVMTGVSMSTAVDVSTSADVISMRDGFLPVRALV